MFDWGYRIESEAELNNREIEATRGKVLGGSSSVSVMVYTRGHRGDYDRWPRNGATGWSFAECLPNADMVGAHINAAVIMIADKIFDVICGRISLPPSDA